MHCKDIEHLKHAYIDQELDSANTLAVAQHLASCPLCAQQIDAILALRKTIQKDTTRHFVPLELQQKIRAMVPGEITTSRKSMKWLPLKWGASGAGMALAACLALFMLIRPDMDYMLEQQLVTSHIRSLQDNHLIDVVSSDQHTVKPWFNGKLDLSPPVVDLVSSGFPLIGGRLDYVHHHPAAVIVYKSNAHIINLFVWSDNQWKMGEFMHAQQGYNMRHWHKGDLQFWAISDVNATKLAEFEKLYRDQTEVPKVN